ncbi:chromosome segregation DNA-binding protein [Ruminococcus sp. CAG:403]|nr:chromosome segregation DNA-binding protein [Ruminococcus sp. CAG:403]
MAKGGLGSGFDFLYDENAADVQVKKTLRLSDMEPNRQQPRKAFAEEAIAALADSIRQYGMLQPILVRPYQGTYQIVAGERRWRAARMLGLDEVPVIIKEISDGEAMEIALIENLQRENLTPMEEANGYRQLMEQYGMTQEAVAKTVGRSRSAVANALRLLQLPEEIQMLLESGAISAGHGKALLAIANPEKQLEAAKRAANGTLTVRAIEKMAVSPDVEPPADPADQKIDSYFKEMELSLQERMGRRVSVQYGKKKGALVLEFYDKDDLAALARRLTE